MQTLYRDGAIYSNKDSHFLSMPPGTVLSFNFQDGEKVSVVGVEWEGFYIRHSGNKFLGFEFWLCRVPEVK